MARPCFNPLVSVCVCVCRCGSEVLVRSVRSDQAAGCDCLNSQAATGVAALRALIWR